MIVDTHCHLYLTEFDTDRPEMLARAKEKGVAYLLLPAINSETHESLIQLARTDKHCRPMMGLHPCYVKDDMAKELDLVASYLKTGAFVAVGECGLDFYWDKTHVREQYEALHQQAELALQYQLPIILHTRQATAETLEAMIPYARRGLRGIFHCFGGTREEASRILDMGFLLGIGGVLTYKNSGLADVVRYTGLTGLVLETDAPYLAPVPMRGKRNESAFLPEVVRVLAQVLALDPATVENETTAQALRCFRMSPDVPLSS